MSSGTLTTAKDGWSEGERPGIKVMILTLAALACYFNSLNCAFILDDQANIQRNEMIRSWWNPQGKLPVYLHHRPLARWTFALNYAVGGLEVWGYHLLNLAIHVSAAIALFFLVRGTLRRPANWEAMQRTRSDRNVWSENFAFAVALLWLVHPLQTESVTYISQRLESMMGLFFLATLYCLLRSAESSQRRLWSAATIAVFSLGVATKEVALMAFPVALLFDRIFLASNWREVFQKRGIIYLGFVPAMAWLVWQLATFRPPSQDAGLYFSGVRRWDYLSTQPEVLLHYLTLVVWPKDLCVDYGWPVTKNPLSIFGLGAIILSMVIASLVMLRYSPRLGFLGFTFFLILAPTSSIVPIADLAFEHRMYLPLAVVLILLVLGVESAWQRWQTVSPVRDARQQQWRWRCLAALLVAVVIPLISQTINRNIEFKTPLSIWGITAKQRPNHIRAQYNYGLALMVDGQYEEAIERLDRAIQLEPKYFRAWHYRGVCYDHLKKFPEALQDYNHALTLKNDYHNTYYRRGDLFLRQHRYSEAIRDFSQFLKFESRNAQVYALRGAAYRELKMYKESAVDLDRALELAPGNDEFLQEREATRKAQAATADDST